MNTYELIDQYAKELEFDTQVDSTNIMEKQLAAPNIKHKWLYRSVMSKKRLLALSYQKEDLINEKLKSSNLPISNPTIKKNLERQPDIMELDREIRQQEILVDYMDNAVKQLNQIGFDYKNIVELMKLENL